MEEPSRGILNYKVSSSAINTQEAHCASNNDSSDIDLTTTNRRSLDKCHSGYASTDPSNIGVTIKIEEPTEQRGRLRNKNNDSLTYSCNRSKTKSRSISCARVIDQECLKWTILNRDPSERLHKQAPIIGGNSQVSDDENDDEEELISDEEVISDVDNNYDLDAELDYNLGARVLPNFASSIQQVVDSQPTWLAAHRADPLAPRAKPDISVVNDSCKRAIAHIAHHSSSLSGGVSPKTFLCYLEDLNSSSAEKLYALTYTFGAVLASNDTFYIIIQCDANDVEAHLERVYEQVYFLLDCTSASLDHLDIVIVALHHQYPRHFLTEMIEAFQPAGLIVPLQIATDSLNNYVTFVPTLVVRKKLKRTKRRGICD